jgi:hypothetical protein
VILFFALAHNLLLIQLNVKAASLQETALSIALEDHSRRGVAGHEEDKKGKKDKINMNNRSLLRHY